MVILHLRAMCDCEKKMKRVIGHGGRQRRGERDRSKAARNAPSIIEGEVMVRGRIADEAD